MPAAPPRSRHIAQDAEEERPTRGEQVTDRLGHTRERSGVPGPEHAAREVSARLKAAPWPRPSSTTHRVLAVEPATRRPKRLHQTCQRPPNDASLRGPPRGDHGTKNIVTIATA